MTVTRQRRWNNRGHRNRATIEVTVKIFCPAVTVTVNFFSSGDDDGDLYSPVLTVMGRNILIIVERGQEKCWGKN